MVKNLRKKFRHTKERGVALLLVLSTLAILSAIVVEFAYNSNVTYNLAMNDLDRVQAYYLAHSGINFTKLVLKFDQEAKKVAKSASKKMGKKIVIQPIYEMIPINTALFRGLTGVGIEGAEDEAPEGEAEEGEAGEEGGEQDALSQGMNFIDAKGAEDFLAFHGDFASEVAEEDSKMNLNIFYGLNPKKDQAKYDRFKSILYHLMVTEPFKGLFEDRYRGAKELTQNIVDFIDKDEVFNETGGQERGREGGRSAGNANFKNGKLISLEELMLVPGMTEPVFQKLKEYVTVYGADKDGKVYICRSQDPLVRAMILAYSENHKGMEPLKDDNEELLTNATDVVLNSCPDTKAMDAALNQTLGVVEEETPKTPAAQSSTKTGDTSKPTTPTKNKSPKFTDLVKENAAIYSIVGIGNVGESEVKIKTIVDASKGSPQNWKELYWRVE